MTIKVGKDCYLPIDNILIVVNYNTKSIYRDVQNRAKAGNVIDLTYGRKTLSVIYLKNGTVVLVNMSPESISRRIEGAEKEVAKQ